MPSDIFPIAPTTKLKWYLWLPTRSSLDRCSTLDSRSSFDEADLYHVGQLQREVQSKSFLRCSTRKLKDAILALDDTNFPERQMDLINPHGKIFNRNKVSSDSKLGTFLKQVITFDSQVFQYC